MGMHQLTLCSLLLLAVAWWDGISTAAPPLFERDVQSILAAHCTECHGKDTQEQGLDLTTVSAMLRGGETGPAFVRGAPEASLLVNLITSGKMPPDEDERLDEEEIDILRKWIAAGAPAEEKIIEPS